MKDIMLRKKVKETIVIGVLGAARGIGTTHVCILLAEYAAMNQGAKTALLEWNDHEDFLRIGREVEGESRQEFYYHEVYYFAMNRQEVLEKIKESQFTYLIIDFGDSLVGKCGETDNCHKKILIGSEALWKADKTIRKSLFYKQKNWRVLNNLSNEGLSYCPLTEAPCKRVQIILNDLLKF